MVFVLSIFPIEVESKLSKQDEGGGGDLYCGGGAVSGSKKTQYIGINT